MFINMWFHYHASGTDIMFMITSINNYLFSGFLIWNIDIINYAPIFTIDQYLTKFISIIFIVAASFEI